MHEVLLEEDLLAVTFEHLGLRHLRMAAATCGTWRSVAARTEEGWRILSPFRTIGAKHKGAAPNQFDSPTCMTDLPNEQICVADTLNHRVICASTCGEPLRMIGINGHKVGELSYPRGLACDGSHIYVADTG